MFKTKFDVELQFRIQTSDSTAEEKRKQHQKELMFKMNEEALRRIKAGGDLKETEKVRKAPVSYRSPGQLPREPEVKQLKIYVGETAVSGIFQLIVSCNDCKNV